MALLKHAAGSALSEEEASILQDPQRRRAAKRWHKEQVLAVAVGWLPIARLHLFGASSLFVATETTAWA